MSQKDIEILDGFITRIKEREKRSFGRTLTYLAVPIIMAILLIVYSAKKLEGASSQINDLQSQLAKSDSQVQGLQAQLADIQKQLIASQKPIIRIIQAPPSAGGPDAISLISGEVKGVNPEDYRVVIYVLTDKWYVQPHVIEPFTPIKPDGQWMTDTHLGRK